MQPTPIDGLLIFEPRVFEDERGFFFESYNAQEFSQAGVDTVFVQDNHSCSKAGVLRGLHFQLPPKAMAKLVRCTRGRLWDVAVDLRPASATYKQWFGLELSEENKRMLFIPEGFAHGFYALEDCQMQYKVSALYDAQLDCAIAWNDPDIGIEWPVQAHPMLSQKDAQAPKLDEIPQPFAI